METIVWLLPGALIGWTGSILMRRTGAQDVLLNVLIGIAGAAFGSWLLGPLLGIDAAGGIGPAQLPMAALGAILSLAAVNLMVPARVLRRMVTFGRRVQPAGDQPLAAQQVSSNEQEQAVRG